MRTVESRGPEPEGGNEGTLFEEYSAFGWHGRERKLPWRRKGAWADPCFRSYCGVFSFESLELVPLPLLRRCQFHPHRVGFVRQDCAVSKKKRW